jgi:hypothetical protein
MQIHRFQLPIYEGCLEGFRGQTMSTGGGPVGNAPVYSGPSDREIATDTRDTVTGRPCNEGCLAGLKRPPRVRITRTVENHVHHYAVVADSPTRLMVDGWMTPLLESLGVGSGAQAVSVYLFYSRKRFCGGRECPTLVLRAGYTGHRAWMRVYRHRFVRCGPVWYQNGKPRKLGRTSLIACPTKPRK